ncbi:alpha/beta hydrolase [Sphingomonas swuensis]|uniref:Palmitoyl-protein thioesterase ABHD10, mitochondrial n=1 Tax=Sphingomonas swuensis TaxID=977800 RepID=A0ABP7S8M1_9SPHN
MDPTWLSLPGDRRLAVRHRSGSGPTLLFLPGYASDMMGSKAVALDALAEKRGLPMLRFDYSGTGESSGTFAEGTLDRWLEEAEAVSALADGPLLLIGSSMGGWLMLLLAERLGPRVQALVGIAAAPDFTSWGYSDDDKAELERSGELRRPNPYGGEAELTTRAFFRSGEQLKLLDRPIDFAGPVRLLHGDRDAEVPLEVAFRTKDALVSADVQLTVVKGGTHRLSEPAELALLRRTVIDLLD